MSPLLSEQQVYVIGLHAFQFGNNWMKKILRTAILNWTRPEEVISKLDKHIERFHSIPRDTTDKEQGGHVGVPNNKRLLVFYC